MSNDLMDVMMGSENELNGKKEEQERNVALLIIAMIRSLILLANIW